MQTMIQVSGLSFGWNGRRVLQDLSFQVSQGEWVTVIGPNGAGKSTLLRCLDGLHPGYAGTIRLLDRPLSDYGRRELARVVSFLPQTDGHAFPFTVYDYVLMGRYPHVHAFRGATAEDHRFVEGVIEKTGIDGFRSRPLTTLSGGERQRVYVAAAIAQDPKVLLLDEPATFLDPKHQSEIGSLLRSLNRRMGITLVVVTHDIYHAALWGDRVIALKQGRLLFSGSAQEAMSPPILHSLFERRFLVQPHPQSGKPVVMPEDP